MKNTRSKCSVEKKISPINQVIFQIISQKTECRLSLFMNPKEETQLDGLKEFLF